MDSFNDSGAPKLFFVCGGRRTGTTLLSAILSSDSRANALGQEAQILTRMIEAYCWGRENFIDFGQSFFANENSYLEYYQNILEQLMQRISHHCSPGNVLVLKNPEFSLVIQDMLSLFPNAVFLACIRDPRDQIASEIEVATRRLTDTGKAAHTVNRNVSALATLYAKYNHPFIALKKAQHGRINFIRYEDMVLKTARTLKQLTDICELELSFNANNSWTNVSAHAGLDKTPSRSANYGMPVNAGSVGRYKNDLNAEEIRTIETVCADIFSVFGYETA